MTRYCLQKSFKINRSRWRNHFNFVSLTRKVFIVSASNHAKIVFRLGLAFKVVMIRIQEYVMQPKWVVVVARKFYDLEICEIQQ